MAVKKSKKRINWEEVRHLAELFCTPEEITEILELDKDEIIESEEFQKFYSKTIAIVKSDLRKLQLDQCKNGSLPMLNLFGKLYLGQNEKGDENFKISEYDLRKLPDYFLNRIIAGENPLRVINEYELANDNKIQK